MSDFRWSNVPIPEGHVIPLVLGLALQLWRPLAIFKRPWPRHLLGWPLLLLGGLIAGRSVAAAGEIDINRPNRIVESGPYRYSRNPMYVAWTLIYAGLTALANSGWLALFLPPLLAYNHFIVIPAEERQLEAQFGAEYGRYRQRTGRYF